jgi:hypothetical protein
MKVAKSDELRAVEQLRYLGHSRSELRAELLSLRLLGKTLPPTLMRFTARAWEEMERRTR